MPTLNFTIEIWRKGKWFLASAPELDFVSQGSTFEEAKKNLIEVIQIQFDEMREMGTLEDYLGECGFIVREGEILPQKEIVGFERSAVQMA
jgi:predicted RNase H-like HicB family nuclease